MKLPKVRMKNIYFKHLTVQPVKLTLLEYRRPGGSLGPFLRQLGSGQRDHRRRL